jgi:hypothetical protein
MLPHFYSMNNQNQRLVILLFQLNLSKQETTRQEALEVYFRPEGQEEKNFVS